METYIKFKLLIKLYIYFFVYFNSKKGIRLISADLAGHSTLNLGGAAISQWWGCKLWRVWTYIHYVYHMNNQSSHIIWYMVAAAYLIRPCANIGTITQFGLWNKRRRNLTLPPIHILLLIAHEFWNHHRLKWREGSSTI